MILGAGLDSFAWRRPDLLRRLRVFEVDHAASQAWKRRRVKDLAARYPALSRVQQANIVHDPGRIFELAVNGLILALQAHHSDDQ